MKTTPELLGEALERARRQWRRHRADETLKLPPARAAFNQPLRRAVCRGPQAIAKFRSRSRFPPTMSIPPLFDSPAAGTFRHIRNFMILIGPISSLYDFLTFFVLLKLFHAAEPLFHTGWFVESLATQTLVLLVIRTAGNPFRSKPSPALLATVVLIVSVGVLLPYTPLAAHLGFAALPAAFFVFLAGATATYLLAGRICKAAVNATVPRLIPVTSSSAG